MNASFAKGWQGRKDGREGQERGKGRGREGKGGEKRTSEHSPVPNLPLHLALITTTLLPHVIRERTSYCFTNNKRWRRIIFFWLPIRPAVCHLLTSVPRDAESL